MGFRKWLKGKILHFFLIDEIRTDLINLHCNVDDARANARTNERKTFDALKRLHDETTLLHGDVRAVMHMFDVPEQAPVAANLRDGDPHGC